MSEFYYDFPNNRRLFFVKGKYITIVYHDILKSMAYSIIEHYDTIDFNNTLIIVNEIVFDDAWEYLNFDSFGRKILYNVEHFETQLINDQTKYWDNNVIYPHIRKHNLEIWDFLIENYDFYPDDLKEKFVFVPLRFSHCFDDYRDLIQNARKKNMRYDLFFSGVHDTPLRLDVIKSLQTGGNTTSNIKFITSTGYDNFNSWDLQAMCKFALDYPHFSLTMQAQTPTRINDMICAGNCVIGFINPKFLNYFEGIIYPAYGDNVNEFTNNVKNIIRNYKPDYTGYIKYQHLTEDESKYNDYRKSLVQKYHDITGIYYPESVCRNII